MKKEMEAIVGLAVLSLPASGCGMNFVDFSGCLKEAPLVVVSDGLFSGDARKFFRRLCDEEKIPYIGEDNVCWFKNKKAIEEAFRQGRESILVGYSAGCDQARLTAEWCNEKNIPVHVIFFDPTYLSFCCGKSIPENVIEIKNYLSERNIPDILAIGKGRKVELSDLKSPKTAYSNCELNGPHIGVFDNNRQVLEKEVRTIIRNNYRRRK